MDLDSILSDLRTERDRLVRAIEALEGTVSRKLGVGRRGRRRTAAAAGTPGRKRRGLTPEGRKRLSEMMKKRWAERRKKMARG